MNFKLKLNKKNKINMRCKICNEKFDASKHFNRKTCFEKECIDEYRIETLKNQALKNLKKIKDQKKKIRKKDLIQ